MPNTADYRELVRHAQLGDQASMDRLAHLAEPRLHAYIYRLTLRPNLAQDLVQETLLEMVTSLKRLKRLDRFWPWLFRTALGKVQMHFRDHSKHPATPLSTLSNDDLLAATTGENDDALSILMGKELAQGILRAMNQLKVEQRNILNLRCFEKMSYRQIARATSSSELNVRVTFYRAKQSLKRHLLRSGFGKGLLLVGLGLFGRVTAGTQAAAATIEVTAATAAVGVPAAALAAVTSKVGAIAAAGATALIATAGVTTVIDDYTPPPPVPFAHYSASPSPLHADAELASIYCTLPHREQMWYYFPHGRTGPVFIQRTKSGNSQQGELFTLLSNSRANYSHSPGCAEVSIENYHPWRRDLRTTRLPSDSRSLREFLDRVEPPLRDLAYKYNRQTDLLRSIYHRAANFYTTYIYNTLDQSDFTPPWSDDPDLTDNRDSMHRRGWTYFLVNGRLNDQIITGYGQIPFVYDAYDRHPPWLRLDLPDGTEIIDTLDGACRISPNGDLTTYASGTFFNGLPRPWMGLHTLDTIRRDAASHRLTFTTKRTDPDTVRVTIAAPQTSLIYTIKLNADLIDTIEFTPDPANPDQTTGTLEFTYFQNVTGLDSDFIEPDLSQLTESAPPETTPTLWLLQLQTPQS